MGPKKPKKSQKKAPNDFFRPFFGVSGLCEISSYGHVGGVVESFSGPNPTFRHLVVGF